MNYFNRLKAPLPVPRQCLFLFLFTVMAGQSLADVASATAAMENPDNPLLEISTSRGSIFVEMLPAEAPENVANFLALAGGEIELIDPDNDFSFFPRYFDGVRFHRAVPGFVIQAGSPESHPLGAPGEPLDDEINAQALGLDDEPLLLADASINPMLGITDKEAFAERVLAPLYASMNISEFSQLQSRQSEVLTRLRTMTLQSLYELQGYSYTAAFPTRPITRGTMALANSGPDSNGPEFFIALDEQPSLWGKYTVIGHVVEGMGVVDSIGAVEIDPLRFSRLSTVIYVVQRVNGAAGGQ